ncbi:MAG: flagellar biosynthetic protein FliO [Gammaproteobacteria bacterium]
MSELMIQKQLVIMVLFLIGILAFFWLFRKINLGAKYNKKGLIKVVSAIALGNKEKLLLVEVQDKKILLGMTASSIGSLHVFEKQNG